MIEQESLYPFSLRFFPATKFRNSMMLDKAFDD